ncbi:hypothetical protein EZV73_24695 [Acidaminobacter sp. JC074]|uniref:hypothetical protein n=1 Tax=Acidaminobacter sp. JC074 TaxID=2530199 RepID=UPI001F0EE68B|nr:hypothetical protein [Acidaminobacter sp. JC074]MCH4890801.1 hypothetical protein [Acidaminobacter sp. JC074]
MKDTYFERTHFYGRLWMGTTFILMLLVPSVVGSYYDAHPIFEDVLKGLMGVAPIFWTVALIEIITFTPMLGTGGSYLGFVTGNLTNLKVPCTLMALENSGYKQGSKEGEIISTIAIAASSITTIIVIAIGVFMLTPLTPILNSELLKPAFDQILPSLFGGLAVVYVSKNYKIAAVPMIFMILVFSLVPSLASAVSMFVPVGAIIAIISARIMYKRGLI